MVFPVVLFILTRFGLLALAGAFFTSTLVSESPLTADFGAWQARATVLPVVVVLGLALTDFTMALAGRSLAAGLFKE